MTKHRELGPSPGVVDSIDTQVQTKEDRRAKERENALRELYTMAQAINGRRLTDDELIKAVALANRFEGKRGMHLRKVEYFTGKPDAPQRFARMEWFKIDDSPKDSDDIHYYAVRILTYLEGKPETIDGIEEYRLDDY